MRMTRFIVIVLLLLLTACEREQRRFRETPPAASQARQTELQPGAPQATPLIKGLYDDNAWAVGEGKRLFEAMNCVGCHAHGGGGMGPALMDDKWIYGSGAQNIFNTIMEGRPNGMPSFRGKLNEQQIWQLAAYVRSMSGQLAKDVSPSRDDDMNIKTPEQSQPHQRPVSQPPSNPQ